MPLIDRFAAFLSETTYIHTYLYSAKIVDRVEFIVHLYTMVIKNQDLFDSYSRNEIMVSVSRVRARVRFKLIVLVGQCQILYLL